VDLNNEGGMQKKKTSWPSFRKRTIPTERPPLVDEMKVRCSDAILWSHSPANSECAELPMVISLGKILYAMQNFKFNVDLENYIDMLK
jgi:hypothetical protein